MTSSPNVLAQNLWVEIGLNNMLESNHTVHDQFSEDVVRIFQIWKGQVQFWILFRAKNDWLSQLLLGWFGSKDYFWSIKIGIVELVRWKMWRKGIWKDFRQARRIFKSVMGQLYIFASTLWMLAVNWGAW